MSIIKIKNSHFTKSLKALKLLAIYYLSAKMICFAIPKFLFMQFRILHWESYVPLVEVSKLQHLWSFFGRSYHYNLFIGLAEFLIGILIVFRRTRLIALLIALGVCTNILILNVEFEVSFAVKHILVDLILTILLLSTYRKDLYKFFINNGGKYDFSPAVNKSMLVSLLPYIFVTVLSISYFTFALSVKSKYAVDESISGAYKIEHIKINDSIINPVKGKLGHDPMMFLEHNNQFVLSIEDTLYKGRYLLTDDRISIYIDHPTNFKMKSIKGVIKNNAIVGEMDENSPVRIIYERISGNKNYLNELYE